MAQQPLPPPSSSLRTLIELIQLDKVMFTKNGENFERLRYAKKSIYNMMHKTNRLHTHSYVCCYPYISRGISCELSMYYIFQPYQHINEYGKASLT